MAKKAQETKIQKRDWAIILLFIAVIGSNYVWYQVAKTNELSWRSESESWLRQQIQINKLKACLDEGTKPCDI